MASFPHIILKCYFLSIVVIGQVWATQVKHELFSVIDPPGTTYQIHALFMGYQENFHHSPSAVYDQILPVFSDAQISLTFTNSASDINSTNLANYDVLIMYGNLFSSGATSSNQPLVPVIRDYVRGGGALVGLHVASAAFRNDARFSELLGGRFLRHTAGQFVPETVKPNHLLVKNLPPLDSYDETYILKDLNPDITILQERVDGENRFPWTWVRNEGAGRVFYTASGHIPWDESIDPYNSIIQPGFSDLVLRGTRWVTKRQFSSFTIGALLASGEVAGGGKLLSPDLQCYWSANAYSSSGLTVEGDPTLINGENYFFQENSVQNLIACPDAGTQIFSQIVQNDLGAAFQGIWRNSQDTSPTPLLLEGRQLIGESPGTIISTINPAIGQGFVASKSGDVLARITTISGTPPTSQTAIFHSSAGTILQEGDSHPSLAPGIVFSNLANGPLSLNSNAQAAFLANLSNSGQAIVRKDTLGIHLPVVLGNPVPSFPNVFWGSVGDIKINSAGHIAAIISLTGEVSPGSDTALIKIAPGETHGEISLREGDESSVGSFVGDLTDSRIVMDAFGECYLINTLTGPLVSTGNDQVLLKVGTIPQIIIREGDFLPTISHTAKIGSSLEESTLNLDPAGNLYFTAQLTANSTHLMTLFRAEGRVIYKVLSEGDSIEIREGSSADIASFTGLLPSGDDDGFPSSSMENSLALSVISSSGHQILTLLKSLDDLDQDGLSNLIEAGTGSSPTDPSFGHRHLPKLVKETGTLSYVFLLPSSPNLPQPSVQTSLNFTQWTDSEETPTLWHDQNDVPEGFQRVGLDPEETLSKQFFRLRF